MISFRLRLYPKNKDTYQGELSVTSGKVHQLGVVCLHPNAELTLKGHTALTSIWLQQLYNNEIKPVFEGFDERMLLDWGQALYDQIFLPLNLDLSHQAVSLQIQSDDEFILRLPWILLAHKGHFLGNTDWSIHYACQLLHKHTVLTPSPKILIAMPQPGGWDATGAEAHEAALRLLLRGVDDKYATEAKLSVVTTWAALHQAMTTFMPDIFYYYGHGAGDFQRSLLIFEQSDGQVEARPVSDLSSLIKDNPPSIAYINCCLGDSGGVLGVGRQLGQHVSTVLCNRTLADVEAAQEQAMAFFEQVLVQGLQPHEAIDRYRSKLTASLSLGDVRWMTTVLYQQYGTFEANPPKHRDSRFTDPFWRLNVDRIQQFGSIFWQVSQMLQEKKHHGLAYIWYGISGQGIQLFHERLTVELPKNTACQFHTIAPCWPLTAVDDQRNVFEDMMAEAFELEFDLIAGKLRSLSQGKDKPLLLYIRTEVVQESPIRLITPRFLKAWFHWLDQVFLPGLPNNCFLLTGVGYVVKDTRKFAALLDKSQLKDDLMPNIYLGLLDVMGHLTKSDLQDFIKTHRIWFPPGKQTEEIDRILAETGGMYEETLDELEQLQQRCRTPAPSSDDATLTDDDLDC